MTWHLLQAWIVLLPTMLIAAELDYHVTDSNLTVRLLDTSPDDSFLSVRCDSAGRVFVGGRKTLFAYDLAADGTYLPRKLLYTFPDHTWVYDIEIRGDDLYVSTVSAIYRLPGARLKREGVTVERLLWGVPNGHVHQCFHALAWGPEGDLYVSMGDPLWYYGDFSRPDHWGHWSMWFKPDEQHPAEKDGWARMPYNGVGAVFRMRPDGTDLRSYARGLRNSCGLCFDREWNLFTNDNDHEGMPALYAPGRLIHVTEGAYYSWPRGWLLSKTPDRADLLPTVNEKMGRAVPVLQTYYDDGYLGEQYNNNLLVTRWCRRTISNFPLQRKGASFTAEESTLLEGKDQARPVGICVGRGGRVFVTVCYMAQNEGSPTYRSDLAVITRKDDPEAMPFEGYEAPTATVEKLWSEIENLSWKRRHIAHQELLRRGGDAVNGAYARHPFSQEQGAHRLQTTVFHTLPIAARLLKQKTTIEVRRELALHQDAGVRRLAREHGYGGGAQPFGPDVFLDNDPQVQLAIITNFVSSRKNRNNFTLSHWDPLWTHADPLVRTMWAHAASKQYLDSWQDKVLSDDPNVRLTGVLSVGFRLTIPALDWQPPAEAPLQPQKDEKANIIEFADVKEPVDLRQWGRIGNYTIAELWKAVPHTEEQELLFGMLVDRLQDEDERVRLQAAHFLSLLNDARSEPLIAKVLTDIQDQRLNVAGLVHVKPVWMLGPLADERGFDTIHDVETKAVDLGSVITKDGKKFEWSITKPTSPDRPLYDFAKLYGPSPNSSVYSYLRLESPTAQRSQLLVGSEDGVKVWLNGKLVHSNDVVRPLIQLDDVVTLDLQPGSNDVLVRVSMRNGLGGMYLHFRHLGSVQISLPEKPDGLSLAERLKSASQGDHPVDPKFLSVDWSAAIKDGDPARGKQLFAGEALGCAKCHAATPNAASGGGPSLADAGKRFTTAYLVESVLAPSRVISPVFKATTIVTTDGKTLTGLVITDTAEKLELLLPNTQKQVVLKADIEERKPSDVSAMPGGIIKAVDELRDVLAYLISNPAE